MKKLIVCAILAAGSEAIHARDAREFWNDFTKDISEWVEAAPKISIHMPGAADVRSNVIEKTDCYEIEMTIPGFTKENLTIDITDTHGKTRVTISGKHTAKKEEEKKEAKERYLVREFSTNEFSRSFTLAKEVMKEKVEASVKDGKLTIVLPKKQPTPTDQTSFKVDIK